MKIFKHKLASDIAWSMGSMVVLAACGILINLTISWFRDASALGAFNQTYAIYIITSQVAVFGLHYSVLRHAALYSSDAEEQGYLLVNAGVFSLVLGVCSAITVYWAAPFFGRILDSASVQAATVNASFGLTLFPLNKVLMGYLNGLRHMKAISVLQSGRYILVLLFVAAVSASTYPFEYVTLGFFIAELATTCGVFVYLMIYGIFPTMRFDTRWTRRHILFGGKSLFSGILVDVNSRVDVLLVGFFLPDLAVGIYSFAAMLVEGVYNVLAFVRLNYNPVLVGNVRDGNWAAAQRLLSQTKKYVFTAVAILSLCVIAVFLVLTTFIVPAKGLNQGLLPLGILLVGLTLISVYIPFDNLMLVSGHPGVQTLQQMAVILTNIVLNIALIPLLGINGAAIATALSYISGIAALIFLAMKMLGWNLLTNLVENQS